MHSLRAIRHRRQTQTGRGVPPAHQSRRTGSRTITLTGFNCGDSCYLEFTDGGESKTALCRASQCSEWADRQALPPTLKSKRATARFGTDNQVDAAGNIMARDYPTIEELTISGFTGDTPDRSAQVGPAVAGQRAADGATGPLGLIKGVYTSGNDCESIANAGLRIYDGVGLSGSATKNCRTKVVSRSGQTYKVSNDCAATYDDKRSTEQFTVRVSGSSRFNPERRGGWDVQLLPCRPTRSRHAQIRARFQPCPKSR